MALSFKGVHFPQDIILMGVRWYEAAQSTLVGIELMHMIKKRQLMSEAGDEGRTAAEQFYTLAA